MGNLETVWLVFVTSILIILCNSGPIFGASLSNSDLNQNGTKIETRTELPLLTNTQFDSNLSSENVTFPTIPTSTSSFPSGDWFKQKLLRPVLQFFGYINAEDDDISSESNCTMDSPDRDDTITEKINMTDDLYSRNEKLATASGIGDGDDDGEGDDTSSSSGLSLFAIMLIVLAAHVPLALFLIVLYKYRNERFRQVIYRHPFLVKICFIRRQ